MHELPLLINISVALALAFVGGFLARLVGLPTIAGYLIAGVMMGPYTPGFVGDAHTIEQLAELGIVFLMFGVGLHFSFRDLWKVRDIAIFGGLGQMVTTALLGYGLARFWGWSASAGVVLGLSISVASTIVLLRGLMDNGLLQTPHGQVAVGWLILEDLATVLILMVLPMLGETSALDWQTIGLTILAALGYVLLMMFVGARLIPLLLFRVARTRSRELFILAVLTISLGTALGATQLFGVSLPLAAFLAGTVAGESPLSHRVGEDLLPFREAFAVLFFISVGMLLNPAYLLANLQNVLLLGTLIVLGKFVVTGLWASLFRRPVKTALVVAAGTSQIGEFSFILGQTGLSAGLLNADQYALILAGSLLSIMVNPFMFRLVAWLEPTFIQLGRWGRKSGARRIGLPGGSEALQDHVVLVGCGRVGGHIADVLEHLAIPYLVVDFNPERIERLARKGVPTVLGDAANSDILAHVGLKQARLLLVTLPEESASELAVAAGRDIAPDLVIHARAATAPGVKRLAALGAVQVIHPELEGGLQLIRLMLLELGFPLELLRSYAARVRREHYGSWVVPAASSVQWSDAGVDAPEWQFAWIEISRKQLLTELSRQWREQTGAVVVAVQRKGALFQQTELPEQIEAGDRVGLVGPAARWQG